MEIAKQDAFWRAKVTKHPYLTDACDHYVPYERGSWKTPQSSCNGNLNVLMVLGFISATSLGIML